jgi:hypothetical protein
MLAITVSMAAISAFIFSLPTAGAAFIVSSFLD